MEFFQRAKEWMTPERAAAFQGIGMGLSQLSAGQPVDLSPAYDALQQRKDAAQMRKVMEVPGLMDSFTPQQRAVLASMPESLATKIIMEQAFQPAPEPVKGVVVGGRLIHPITGKEIYTPPAELDGPLADRTVLAAAAGLQPNTPEYNHYILTGDLPKQAGGDLPAAFASLDLQAKAAGLQPGTPEYEAFMLNGGASGTPAAFTALDMQAQAAGFVPGSPEYKDFMATRGAGLAAQATAEGRAAGEATASAPTMISNGEIAIQGISEIRNHPGLARGTGMSSVFNAVPGTDGFAFQTRVEQLAGGAFLTAIQQLQGMGALSNSEGQTATAALARLNTGLSEAEFKDALDDYEAIVKRGMERAKSRLEPAVDKPAALEGDDPLGLFQ